MGRLLAAALLVAFFAAFSPRASAESAGKEKEGEEGPITARKAPASGWIVDKDKTKSKVTQIRIFKEHLGFFNLQNIPIEDFAFKLGKAEILVSLSSLKSMSFEGADDERKAVMTSFFKETFEALVDNEVKITLSGMYEFTKFEILLSDVASLEFDAPEIPIMYCEGCKRYSAQRGFSFCPHDGNRLRFHSTALLGQNPEPAGGESREATWKGWAADVESGITAHVEDARGRKIDVEDVQFYRERLGLLSISQEPIDALKLKIGRGSVNVELSKIKSIRFEGKTAEVTDFEDKSFKADCDPAERFFLKGRYYFGKISIDLADVRSATFMPPPGPLARCGFCNRLYSQKEWTHCPYDGTPLK